MQFVDHAKLEVRAGDGGDGAVAFRRESHRPMGGPSGGDGGRGGSIVFIASTRLGTLLDFRYRREIQAAKGENGRGKDQYGRGGKDVRVEVPVGTQVFDEESGELVVDLCEPEQEYVIARGGDGGRGNIHFASSYDRAPRRNEPGWPGEKRRIRLELRLVADVGVMGYPNVGKSTFIASVSRARPKVADYPFTTLVPNLGVASLGPGRSFVIADIPGIIEGAAEGAGLGLRFLRHVERTRVLLHVLSPDPDPDREIEKDFDVLMDELRRYDAELAGRQMLVVVGKQDLPEGREALEVAKEAFAKRGIDVLGMSGATGEGTREVLERLERMIRDERGEDRDEIAERYRGLDKPHEG